MMIENDTLFDWLHLIRTPNVGPITFWRLLERHGSARNALLALPTLANHLHKPYNLYEKDAVEQELKKAQKHNIHIIPAFDPAYPPLLKHVPDAPPLLYVWGEKSILTTPGIGIVGARNSSLMARRLTEQFARELGEAGYSIVSGLARGIDRHAHLASLTTGTIAVVAGGVDVIYPPEHQELHAQIRETGCVISEMPLGLHPGSTHFPRRNRIISGISQGTIVMEAALKSGSLITARYTLEQNRELFAVPGSPQDPRCQGTNDLIRKGAHLTQTSSDVLEVLKSNLQSYVCSSRIPASLAEDPLEYNETDEEEPDYTPDVPLTQKILQDLSYTPVSIDFLINQYQTPAVSVMSSLLDLELMGDIVRYSNGMIALQDKLN